jgi:signal peptidase I
VFRRPPGWPKRHDADFIDRVIGPPGDHVVCCTANHQLTVKGNALIEPYLDLAGDQPADAYTPYDVTVPAHQLFVLGDHRDDSDDSRVHGPVPISDVIGRISQILLPATRTTALPGLNPATQPT